MGECGDRFGGRGVFMCCHAAYALSLSCVVVFAVGAGLGKFVNRLAPGVGREEVDVFGGAGVLRGGGGNADVPAAWLNADARGGTFGVVVPLARPALLRSPSYLTFVPASLRIS